MTVTTKQLEKILENFDIDAQRAARGKDERLIEVNLAKATFYVALIMADMRDALAGIRTELFEITRQSGSQARTTR